MHNVIYYFTGTGNSMRAATKIAQQLGDTEIISMRCDPASVPATECDMVGFVFPVYHWTMPAPAVHFVEALQINPNAYIFAVAMPSFVNGISCEKLAELLAAKGLNMAYGEKVHSVANYAIVYPPMPSPKLVVPRTERKLERIAREIAQRKTKPYPKAGVMVNARRDKVMTPYLELQKYADYPFTITESCISCGLCARVCPCSNIELQEGKPTFLHHCAQCMACVTSCPKRAIGYCITSGDQQLLSAGSKNTPLVKLMGLPGKRKLYRNPYITVHNLTKDRMMIERK
ncbi:MAG TPA: EFR1 family ferrodoxin [Thermoclostridium sp.]|nr:EFR1 family ferrodoxin [Thermoclostridium sp.]